MRHYLDILMGLGKGMKFNFVARARTGPSRPRADVTAACPSHQ